MGLLQKAKDKAVAFTEGELATAGVAKVRELLSRFTAAMPLLEEAGCTPSGVDVDVGLPPKVVANFATSCPPFRRRRPRLRLGCSERVRSPRVRMSPHGRPNSKRRPAAPGRIGRVYDVW